MKEKKIDMSDSEYQIKDNFGDDETSKNNTFSHSDINDFEEGCKNYIDNLGFKDEELNKLKLKCQLENIFKIIYVKYSEAALDLNNTIMLKEEAPKDFKAGFQNAVMASLQILLNVRNEMVNK